MGSSSEYCHDIWYRKARMVDLPDGEKSLRIFTSFDTLHEYDRLHIETVTSRQHKPHLQKALREETVTK